MINLENPMDTTSWKRVFTSTLGTLLKSAGFRRKGILFVRENPIYWEAYRLTPSKWGRAFFLEYLHGTGAVEFPIDTWKMKRVEGSILFPYNEYCDIATHIIPIEELILKKSNDIAKFYNQSPPHLFQLENKIPCSPYFGHELVLMRAALHKLRPLDSEVYYEQDFYYTSLLLGDFGIDLPSGWELIKRYDRQYYATELKHEYYDFYKPTQELESHSNEFLDVVSGVPSFVKYLYIPIAITKNANRVLFMTNNIAHPLVSIILDFTGETAASSTYMQPLFYASISSIGSPHSSEAK